MTVSDSTAQHIAALVVGLTYGQNCRPGPVQKPSENQSIPGAIPEECVFCVDVGGPKNIPYIDGGAGTSESLPGVFILVRSEVNDYDGGKTLSDEIFSAIDMNPPTGFFESRAQTSQPVYLSKDETNHHQFTLDVILKQ